MIFTQLCRMKQQTSGSKINLGAIFCAFVLGVMTCVVSMNDLNDADTLVNNATTSVVMTESTHEIILFSSSVLDQLSIWQILGMALTFVLVTLFFVAVAIYYLFIAPMIANTYPVTVSSSYMLLFLLSLFSLPTAIGRLAMVI